MNRFLRGPLTSFCVSVGYVSRYKIAVTWSALVEDSLNNLSLAYLSACPAVRTNFLNSYSDFRLPKSISLLY